MYYKFKNVTKCHYHSVFRCTNLCKMNYFKAEFYLFFLVCMDVVKKILQIWTWASCYYVQTVLFFLCTKKYILCGGGLDLFM